MKAYVSALIPRIKRFSKKLDNFALITGKQWIVIDESLKQKLVYIFRKNHDLLISVDGKVDKGRWDYIDEETLLIEKSDGNYLLKRGFIENNVLVLKVDNFKNEYAFLINAKEFEKQLNTIEAINKFLEEKYLLQKNNVEDIIKIKQDPSLPRPNLNKMLDEVFEKVAAGQAYKYFDKDQILSELMSIYYLTKNDEVTYFIRMEELENDLLVEGELCENCMALNSIENNQCKECNEINICTLCSNKLEYCQCYYKSPATKKETLLLRKYKISFENDLFVYKEHKYAKAIDAINYAKQKESKNV